MKNKIATLIVSVSMAAISGSALAQFSAPKLPGASSGSSSVSAEGLVKNYVSGTKSVMSGNSKMLKAIGLKDQAAKEELAAKNLTEGATSSALEDAAKVQTESSKALADKMAEKKVVLDAEGKKNYTAGLVDLAKGIKSYSSVGADAKNFKPNPASLGGAGEAAMYVVKTLPDSSTNLMSLLKRAVEFAKENKIEVPAEATSLL